jgi:hypothetical protein
VEWYKALLISEKNLDCKPYNRTEDAVTWETCTLRAWLNNEFLNAAFTPEEQDDILATMVKNEDNPHYNTDGGRDTLDRVFLLSIAEAERFFKDDAERQALNTPYVKTMMPAVRVNLWREGNLQYFKMVAPEFSWWWLRSPGIYSYATGVDRDGNVNSSGIFVDDDNDAVRPALWIDLDSGIF